MFSFIRLIDGSSLVGNMISESEYEITLTNALIMGIEHRPGEIEQKYFFKGMYCPFTTGGEIHTVLEKRNIVSFHSGLDSHLESQYNKYIKDWFKARTDFQEFNLEEVEKALEESLDMLQAMSEVSANTNIH